MMSNRILVCCLTISIAMSACVEDKQVIPTDPVIQISGSFGKTVRQADLDCCYNGKKCNGNANSQNKTRGQACIDAAKAYAAADDTFRALDFSFRACEFGKLDQSVIRTYNDLYGNRSHRNEDDLIGERQRDIENAMIACCQSQAISSYTETKEFCSHLSNSFSLAKRTGPRKLVLKEQCNNFYEMSACLELKEFQGKPYTEEMYRAWQHALQEGKRLYAEQEAKRLANEAAARAYAPVYTEQNYYEEPQEQALPVEEEPEPVIIESSPSWGDAAVQAINAARGQDPVQAELNRQLARINAAGRQPPPVRVSPPAPVRNKTYRPSTVYFPPPSRPPQPNAFVPYTPPPAPVPAYNYPPVNNTNTPSGVTSEPPKSVSEQRKGPQHVYEPGAQYDGCIGFFYDPKKYNWYSIRNSCSVDIRWVMINPGGSGIVNSGGTDCTGESRSEVAQHPNRQFAFCREGFIPVDAQDRYWKGGQYRCLESR